MFHPVTPAPQLGWCEPRTRVPLPSCWLVVGVMRDPSSHVLLLSVLCCVSSLVVPLLIFRSFEMGDPIPEANRPAGYLLLHSTDILGTDSPDVSSNVSHEHECATLCDHTPDCTSFTYHPQQRRCRKVSTTFAAVPMAGMTASLRQRASWPRIPPARLRWRHNVTLVVGWGGAPLGWLRGAFGLADVALVAAPPLEGQALDGQTTAGAGGRNGSAANAAPEGRSSAAGRRKPRSSIELLRRRLLRLSPDSDGGAGDRGRLGLSLHELSAGLTYFTELAHVPLARDESPPRNGRGGLAKAPARAVGTVAAVHFVLAFWDNLPPWVVFADDGCAPGLTAEAGGRSPYISPYLPTSPEAGGRSAAAACAPAMRPSLVQLAARAEAADPPLAAGATPRRLAASPPPPGEGSAAWRSPAGCMCTLLPPQALEAHVTLPPRATAAWLRWYRRELLGGPYVGVGGAAVRRAGAAHLAVDPAHEREPGRPPPGAYPATPAGSPAGGHFAASRWRLRRRPRDFYRALLQLLLIDHKYRGVSAHQWALVVQAQWFELLGAPDSRPSAHAPPRDPCFYTQPACDPDLPSRLRARSAELLRKVMMRASVGEITGEMSDTVKRWWRRARTVGAKAS